MKTINSKISIIVLVLTIILNNITLTAAVPTQWFPQVGTRVEHKLSFNMKFEGGALIESDMFNVYSYGVEVWIMAVPLDDAMEKYPSATSMINNTEVAMIHSYTEGSSIELNRTTTFIINNTEYKDTFVYFLRYTTDSGFSALPFKAKSIFITKSDFLTSITYDILDYFDNTAGSGTEIVTNHNVLAVSNDHIIVLNIAGLSYNTTHIADKTGKVHTYIFSDSTFTIKSRGIQSISYILSSVRSSSSIPSFRQEFIILSAGLAILMIVKKFRVAQGK